MINPFSERIGVKPPKALQLESLDGDLRHSLWNLVYLKINELSGHTDRLWFTLTDNIALRFQKIPLDELPEYSGDRQRLLKKLFLESEWFVVYDLVEHIASWFISDLGYKRNVIDPFFNAVLTKELSGYRFVAGRIEPITNPTEIEEINQAIANTKDQGLEGASEHLNASLVLLGRKPHPDYRNSIKEAISAVESVAKQISGKNKATLGPALDELGKSVEIHPSFKEALKKLYGYTNDEGGIRHALLEEKDIGFDEAKFMIVACSAFVNFLISKADRAKLLK